MERVVPSEGFYSPLLSRAETTARLDSLHAKPQEQLTDEDMFQAIADTFATIGREDFEHGETGPEGFTPVDWEENDEISGETSTYGVVFVGYYKDTETVEKAFIEFPSYTIKLSRDLATHSLSPTRCEVEEDEHKPHSLSPEERKGILTALTELLESTNK